MMYGREYLSLEEVQFILHSRVLQNKLATTSDTGEVWIFRVGLKYNSKIKNNRDKSKSKWKLWNVLIVIENVILKELL